MSEMETTAVEHEEDKSRIKRPIYKRWWFWVIAIFSIIAILIGLLLTQGTRYMERNMVNACHNHVLDYAKYPGGVDFIETEVIRGENDDYFSTRRIVGGKVDFPNGFGTPVRHSYLCTVDFGPDPAEVNVILNKTQK